MLKRVELGVGDLAPGFAYAVSSAARKLIEHDRGKELVLCFFGDLSLHGGIGRRTVAAWRDQAALFDARERIWIAIGSNPADAADPALHELPPGMFLAHDDRGDIARAYGLLQQGEGGRTAYRCSTILVNRDHTCAAVVPLRARDSAAPIAPALRAIETWGAERGERAAPVLELPRVLEPPLCRELIAAYERHGGAASGYMRQVDGMTELAIDPHVKIRADYALEDGPLRDALKRSIHRRLVPQVARVFQFQATRIERHIVACYDAKQGGHFAAHRDNTTTATAHRRFAVTINLNADDYDGGDLVFPEFGRVRYRASTGGAIVFSCSLVHLVLPLTRGRRYCTLPFLYDEESAALRVRNQAYVVNRPPPDDAATRF